MRIHPTQLTKANSIMLPSAACEELSSFTAESCAVSEKLWRQTVNAKHRAAMSGEAENKSRLRQGRCEETGGVTFGGESRFASKGWDQEEDLEDESNN